MGAEPSPQRPSLLERFPALKRLAASASRRRIPEVRQMAATDCGAACLAMVLGYYGRHLSLEEVRHVTGVSRDGTSALGLLEAARRMGLRGRGISLEVDSLHLLPTASILHWRFTHYVIFERLERGGVLLVDPAEGRRWVSMDAFRKCFTGVALVLEPGEGFTPGRSTQRAPTRFLLPLLRHSGVLGRILVLSGLLQLFALALPAVTGALIDQVIPRSNARMLAVLGAGLLVLVTFQLLTALVRGHLLLELRTRLDAEMTLGFLEHLVRLPFSFFQVRPAGDLLMRMGINSTVREMLSTSALSTVLDGTLVLLYLLVLLVSDWRLGLLTLGLGAAQVLVFWTLRRRQQALLAQNLERDARNQGYLVEMLLGMQTLKAFGTEQQAVQSYSNLFVDVLNLGLARGRLATWVDALTSTLRLASPLALLCFGAWEVLEGRLTLGRMFSLNALAGALLVPLASLISTAGQLLLLGSYLERLNDVLESEPERPEEPGLPVKLQGACELHQVSFRYAPMLPLVVRDISVSIAPGQLVAIVGPSGAGKSTLAHLLLGLYLPSSGRVLYDGRDLAELDLQSVRSQVGVVLQEPAFFGTTLRANITLGNPDIPLEEVILAARLAQIHEDILSMPLGYDTPIGDRGLSLSGGQRQRLGLARALVRKPSLLLLDEATSALDAVTEQRIQEALASLRCTRIVIAHRLSTILEADLILVMDKGQLVEQGSHASLMAQGGLYARLIHAQVRGQGTARTG